MVLGQAVDHFIKGTQPGGRQHTGLPHPAAQQLAHPAGPLDEVSGPGQHRADRRTESL